MTLFAIDSKKMHVTQAASQERQINQLATTFLPLDSIFDIFAIINPQHVFWYSHTLLRLFKKSKYHAGRSMYNTASNCNQLALRHIISGCKCDADMHACSLGYFLSLQSFCDMAHQDYDGALKHLKLCTALFMKQRTLPKQLETWVLSMRAFCYLRTTSPDIQASINYSEMVLKRQIKQSHRLELAINLIFAYALQGNMGMSYFYYLRAKNLQTLERFVLYRLKEMLF